MICYYDLFYFEMIYLSSYDFYDIKGIYLFYYDFYYFKGIYLSYYFELLVYYTFYLSLFD